MHIESDVLLTTKYQITFILKSLETRNVSMDSFANSLPPGKESTLKVDLNYTNTDSESTYKLRS